MTDDSKYTKRKFLQTAGTAGAIGIAGCMGSDDDEITLGAADYLPEGHVVREAGITPFLDRVRELADTEIEFEEFPAGQLGDASELPSVIQQETAEMGIVAPAQAADVFSLSGVAELPGLFDTARGAAEALHDVGHPDRNAFLHEEEYADQNLRLLFAGLWPPYQVYSVDDPIVSLKDWEGRSVRSGGGIMSVTVDELGGTPVEMSAPEIYTSMERGVIDSSVGPHVGVPAYDLEDQISSFSTNLSLGSFVFNFMINADVYDRLPDDVQTALDQAGEEITTEMGEEIDQLNDGLAAQFEDEGLQSYEVPPSDLDAIESRLNEVEQIWVDQRTDNDESGAEMLDAYKDALGDV